MSSHSQKSSQTTTNPYAIQQFNSANAALGNKSYTPLTGTEIQSYENPYTQSVINSTLALSNQNQAQALNANKDAAIKAGAFDTSGLGVQNALTQGQYDLNNQQTIAGLNAANYSQALQTAQSENQAANQYPLAIQALLGNLAQGTQSNSSGKSTSTGDWSPSNGFSFGG